MKIRCACLFFFDALGSYAWLEGHQANIMVVLSVSCTGMPRAALWSQPADVVIAFQPLDALELHRLRKQYMTCFATDEDLDREFRSLMPFEALVYDRQTKSLYKYTTGI